MAAVQEDEKVAADFLAVIFNVNSPDKIQKLNCKTFHGFASKQFRFQIVCEDKKVPQILFIKKVDTSKIDSTKEILMYSTFLPEVLKYATALSKNLGEKIENSFIKFYGDHEKTEGDKSLHTS